MDVLRAKPKQVEVSKEGEEEQMPIGKYGSWFRAIKDNNTTLMEKTLSESSALDQNLLLNGKFKYHEVPKDGWEHSRIKQPLCKYERPLFVAAVHRSIDAILFLLQNGANIQCRDLHGSTIVHALLWASLDDEENADDYGDIYLRLMAELSEEEKKELLLCQDQDKMLPIELAMAIGNTSFFLKIFQTEKVYKHSGCGIGMYAYNMYDITDYETFDKTTRRKTCPLRMLTYLTKQSVSNTANKKALMVPCIQHWIDYMLALYRWPLYIWALLRVTFHFVFVVVFGSVVEIIMIVHLLCKGNAQKICSIKAFASMAFSRTSFVAQIKDSYKTENYTTITPNISLSNLNSHCLNPLLDNLLDDNSFRKNVVSLLVYLFSIVLSIVCLHNILFRIKRAITRKNTKHLITHSLLVNNDFQLFATTTFSFSVIGCVMTLSLPRTALCLYIIASVMNLFCFLYFLQFSPFGYFAVTIQRMFMDLASFLLILLIFITGFSLSFNHVLHSGTQCKIESPNFGVYESFKVMLNMVDFSDWERYLKVEVALLHFLHVLVIPILLVNFLVALMSSSVAEISENRFLIMQLTYLDACLSQETWISFFCRIIYRYIQKKHLVEINGRFYLPVLEIDSRKNRMISGSLPAQHDAHSYIRK